MGKKMIVEFMVFCRTVVNYLEKEMPGSIYFVKGLRYPLYHMFYALLFADTKIQNQKERAASL